MPTATPAETVVAVLAMALIVLICRWVFSPTHTRTPTTPGDPDYGLLVPVAKAPTYDDAVLLRDLLVSQGVRASLSADLEVLVFQTDAERARTLVGG